MKLLDEIKKTYGSIQKMAISNRVNPQRIHSILDTIAEGGTLYKPSIQLLARLLPKMGVRELTKLYGKNK